MQKFAGGFVIVVPPQKVYLQGFAGAPQVFGIGVAVAGLGVGGTGVGCWGMGVSVGGAGTGVFVGTDDDAVLAGVALNVVAMGVVEEWYTVLGVAVGFGCARAYAVAETLWAVDVALASATKLCPAGEKAKAIGIPQQTTTTRNIEAVIMMAWFPEPRLQ